VKPALEIQNISKRFSIHHEKLPYLSFRDKLTRIFQPSDEVEQFWALKDVAFNVEQGESIGIVGRNGAGKSTLLKILSRITPPTKGRIITRGRIASLLEVGTGFHQELTGRENIFMNGSILGMKKTEIINSFDEIVDFSGVEKFIDTPLKHYSSGMQLRLAFAVAAHLEPEVLIIDEVLAVGDAEFQRKCMGKMEQLSSKQGRTILFVSHNTAAISQLCKTGVYLENGVLKGYGKMDEVINAYLKPTSLKNRDIEIKELIEYKVDFFRVDEFLVNEQTHPMTLLKGNKLKVDVIFSLKQDAIVELEIHLKKADSFIASSANFLRSEQLRFVKGQHKLCYDFELPDLLNGDYQIHVDFTHPQVATYAYLSQPIQVEKHDFSNRTPINSDTKNWSKVILKGAVKKV
jgi:ABC-type polysaccharide/polyol phosphate transport system ATPase subunit